VLGLRPILLSLAGRIIFQSDRRQRDRKTATFVDEKSLIRAGSNITIGSTVFSLTSGVSALEFSDLSGTLWDVTYAGTNGPTSLATTVGYVFNATNAGPQTIGSFSGRQSWQ
jgi:hypothetical protein